MKRTPWFPAHIKPVNVGVYRVKSGMSMWWSYWDGKRWGFREPTKHGAYVCRYDTAYVQALEWYGVLK
jgi:hypothetical protein